MSQKDGLRSAIICQRLLTKTEKWDTDYQSASHLSNKQNQLKTNNYQWTL